MTFKPDDALDHAINVFCAKGYCGASLDDLTKAMGINRPSLYSTFGNKHNLYLEVIRRYSETLGGEPAVAFFDAPDIKKAVAAFLDTTIHIVTAANRPRGCLIANVACDDAAEDEQVRTILAEMFSNAEQAFTARMAQARDTEELPDGFDPGRTARLALSASHSLAIRARIGASRSELEQISQDFMDLLFPD